MPTDNNFLFTLFLLTFLAIVTRLNGEREELHFKSCSSANNYTNGSTYQANLQVLLDSLQAKTGGTSYYYFNNTVGNDSDIVYGMAMCYAYDDQRYCDSCVTQAAKEILQYCPYSKSSAVWYWPCRLQYSDENFISVLETSSQYNLFSNGDNANETIEFRYQLDQLITQVIARAITVPYLFALGQHEVAVNKTIYAFVQCKQSLKSEECGQCLTGYKESLIKCCGLRHMTVTSGLSCHIVFALWAFSPAGALITYLNPPALSSPPAPSPANMQPPSPANTLIAPTPDLVPSVTVSRESKNKIAAIASSAFGAFLIIIVAGLLFWRRKQRKHIYTGESHTSHDITLEDGVSGDFQLFQLAELKFATKIFSENNKLGQGGFGPVYKGLLREGKEIAVKRLAGWSTQGYLEFKNEVEFLAKLKHKNLVKLLGYCLERNEKLLCYEYLPCGSLDGILFATDKIKREKLSWQTRYKIIEGISSGLQYLHIESGFKIIHRDLKPSNILLDEDMNPKISDFGLARFYKDDQTHKETSMIAGTYGYMAPEYAMHGMYSEKLDVYSFGIMLLEIVTGRKNSSFCNNQLASNLISHVWQHWVKGEVEVLKDPALEDECLQQLSRCIHIGLLCVQESPINRPNMDTVNFMLRNNSMAIPALPRVTIRPDFLLSENSMSSTSNSDLARSDQTSSSQNTEASIGENNMSAMHTR